MAASVAVLLRGPFHGDRVQYKFGVLEPNNYLDTIFNKLLFIFIMTKNNSDLSLAEQNHPTFKQITFLSVFSYSFILHSPSCVQFFATPWTAARQASPSLTIFELAQVHVLCIGDAIKPSHPLTPFSLCPQSFPASGSFPVSQFFQSGGRSRVQL